MTEIRTFAELSAADVATAGGKGANLGALFNAGVPVPDGFVILTGCYDRFLNATGLDGRLQDLLRGLDSDDIAALATASERATAWLLGAVLPEETGAAILAHFDRLGAPLVAVRSSANAEDSADSAWAGQLETYLGTTRADLLDHVRRCWASLFTPRALAYRFQNRMMTAGISVAVVVQSMIDSAVAGVAFTVHPVTQDPDQMIIEAGFGLGEAVVSGAITPDSTVVRKSDRQIIESYPSEQARALYLGPQGGSAWRDLPADLIGAPKLQPQEVAELAEIALGIEARFGYPCDIEWARKDRRWYVLQCRPITTLADNSKTTRQPP